jgi:WD40 repeat protein
LEIFEVIFTLKDHSDHINSLMFSANGKYLVSGSSDNTIKVWFLETYEGFTQLIGLNNAVTSLAFSADK